MSTTSLDALLADEPLLTLPEAADRLGIVITRFHDLINAKKVLVYTRSGDGARFIPETFFNEDKDTINKFASGLITVLSDGGYNDEEILEFMFTEDDSLPGRPADAIHGHLAREVIRRAQAMAL